MLIAHTTKNLQKMKINEIRTRFKKVKALLSEYDMLCTLVRVTKRIQKEEGIEMDEVYMQNVDKRIASIEIKLKEIFSF